MQPEERLRYILGNASARLFFLISAEGFDCIDVLGSVFSSSPNQILRLVLAVYLRFCLR